MNKKAIIVVFVMFSLPVVLATLMHSQWLDWTPSSTRNHGTLISPVIQWEIDDVMDADGSLVGQRTLSGKWHLVLHNRGAFDESTLENLYWLRQVRLAQDRHVPEIGLLLIQQPPLSEAQIEEIKAVSDVYSVISSEAYEPIGELFPTPEGSQMRYILDPMANIIMSYQEEQAADDIRKDLGRLLTWTQNPVEFGNN